MVALFSGQRQQELREDIGRLRAAIEDDPKQPKRIITVRGAGYVFAKAHDA